MTDEKLEPTYYNTLADKVADLLADERLPGQIRDELGEAVMTFINTTRVQSDANCARWFLAAACAEAAAKESNEEATV